MSGNVSSQGVFRRYGFGTLAIGLSCAGLILASAGESSSSPGRVNAGRKVVVKVEQASPEAVARHDAALPATSLQSGQRVFIDPRTRRVREAAPEEIQALLGPAESRGDEAGFTPVFHADGTISVELGGEFLNFSVARVNPDGSLTQECFKSQAELGAFLRGETTPATKKEELHVQ